MRRDAIASRPELRAVLAAADALAGAAHELARGESGECLFCSMGGVIVGPYSEDEEHAADCPIRAYRAARRATP